MRRENDLYTTNEKLVDLLFETYSPFGAIVEPCAGPGRMSGAINRWAEAQTITNDIDTRFDCDFHGDACDPMADVWQSEYDFQWAISNPPFGIAEKMLPVIWGNVDSGMAMLLRLSYQEPTKGRHKWLIDMSDHLRYQIIVNPRPMFRKGEINPRTGKMYGSDQVTVAWFVWNKTWSWKTRGLACPFQYAHGWR